MLLLKRCFSWLLSIGLALALASVCLSHVSFAAAVKVCKKLKESGMLEEDRSVLDQRRVYCTITPRLGTVGDYVEIKNQHNYIVAIGRVIKQGKTATIIALTKSNRDEGAMAGYPVMLRMNENQDYWTATTAPF